MWVEGGAELGGAEAGDSEGLAAAGGPGEQSDAGARDVQLGGEEGDESLIGTAIGGRRGEGDLERAVVDAGDGVAPRSWMDADREGAAFGAIADCEVCDHKYVIRLRASNYEMQLILFGRDLYIPITIVPIRSSHYNERIVRRQP